MFTSLAVLIKTILLCCLDGAKTFFLYFLSFVMLCLGSCGTQYDAELPNTDANKKGFEILTGIPPGKNIRNIYFYADEFCLKDPLYCVAFTAEIETVRCIINKRNMKQEKDVLNNIHLGPESLSWWDRTERKKSLLYVAKNDAERIEYFLWHNPENGKCQFMKFCY